jgi:hypothetical protein
MTSVQTASAAPQGGASIPPGIKTQDLRNMYAVSLTPSKLSAYGSRVIIDLSRLVAHTSFASILLLIDIGRNVEIPTNETTRRL